MLSLKISMTNLQIDKSSFVNTYSPHLLLSCPRSHDMAYLFCFRCLIIRNHNVNVVSSCNIYYELLISPARFVWIMRDVAIVLTEVAVQRVVRGALQEWLQASLYPFIQSPVLLIIDVLLHCRREPRSSTFNVRTLF